MLGQVFQDLPEEDRRDALLVTTDGMLLDDAEELEAIMELCADIQARANHRGLDGWHDVHAASSRVVRCAYHHMSIFTYIPSFINIYTVDRPGEVTQKLPPMIKSRRPAAGPDGSQRPLAWRLPLL